MILPHAGDAFEWRDTGHGPVLVCRPLEEVASHLFTTRPWRIGQSRHVDTSAWAEIAAVFGVDAAAHLRPHQVHGDAAVLAEELDTRSERPQADIVLARHADHVVSVQVADCVPLLIADRRLGVVAAAHAGWRGLALGVPRTTVERLASAYGSRADDLVAAIGPSVGACCYEVGHEVREAFADARFANGSLDRWFLPSAARLKGNPPMPGVPTDGRDRHWFFDGWASAREQLREAGLGDAQIFSAQLCTASHPDVFCSYRRDGAAAGRIAGAIRPSLRRPQEPAEQSTGSAGRCRTE